MFSKFNRRMALGVVAATAVSLSAVSVSAETTLRLSHLSPPDSERAK